MSAPFERGLMEGVISHALTIRAATDPQKKCAAQADLTDALHRLSTAALWDLRRALDLVDTQVAAEHRSRS